MAQFVSTSLALLLAAPLVAFAKPIASSTTFRSHSSSANTTAVSIGPLETTGIAPGVAVKTGTELRILPVGDSITVGFEDPNGDGYRFELLTDLSGEL